MRFTPTQLLVARVSGMTFGAILVVLVELPSWCNGCIGGGGGGTTICCPPRAIICPPTTPMCPPAGYYSSSSGGGCLPTLYSSSGCLSGGGGYAPPTSYSAPSYVPSPSTSYSSSSYSSSRPSCGSSCSGDSGFGSASYPSPMAGPSCGSSCSASSASYPSTQPMASSSCGSSCSGGSASYPAPSPMASSSCGSSSCSGSSSYLSPPPMAMPSMPVISYQSSPLSSGQLCGGGGSNGYASNRLFPSFSNSNCGAPSYPSPPLPVHIATPYQSESLPHAVLPPLVQVPPLATPPVLPPSPPPIQSTLPSSSPPLPSPPGADTSDYDDLTQEHLTNGGLGGTLAPIDAPLPPAPDPTLPEPPPTAPAASPPASPPSPPPPSPPSTEGLTGAPSSPPPSSAVSGYEQQSSSLQPLPTTPPLAQSPYTTTGDGTMPTNSDRGRSTPSPSRPSPPGSDYGEEVHAQAEEGSGLNCEDAELRAIVDRALRSTSENLDAARKIESDAAAKFGGRFNSIVSSSEFAYVNWYGKRNCQLRVNNRHSLTWED